MVVAYGLDGGEHPAHELSWTVELLHGHRKRLREVIAGHRGLVGIHDDEQHDEDESDDRCDDDQVIQPEFVVGADRDTPWVVGG